MKEEANPPPKRKHRGGKVREGKFQNLRFDLGTESIRSDGLPTSPSGVEIFS
jgi:hypothetical protein